MNNNEKGHLALNSNDELEDENRSRSRSPSWLVALELNAKR